MRALLAIAAVMVGQITYAAAELPAQPELEMATTCKLAWDTTGPGWGQAAEPNDAARLVDDFADADENGDGWLSRIEFLNACIDGNMAQTAFLPPSTE